MELLLLLIAAVLIVAVGIWLFIAHQGDAEMDFLTAQRTEFKLDSLTPDTAVFSCKVPFVNKGTQDGTIMDCYPRHLMPKEYYDKLDIRSRLTLDSNPREDGYWEAFIVFKTTGDSIVLTLQFTAKDGDIAAGLAGLPDMPVDIVYQVVARADWYITKQTLNVSAGELKKALADAHMAAQTA